MAASLSSADYKALYTQPPPAFGKEVTKYFSLDPEYANLNNGSYGTPPKPVLQAIRELTDEIESNPDLFHRITYQETLKQVRTEVAKLVGAHPDEIVIVTNATSGINNILRNFDWDKDDVIISFSTSYTSTKGTVNYLSDVPPHPKKSVIHLEFPTANEAILEQFKAHLKSPELQVGPNNKRVVIIDSIISLPGVALPWKEMVKICKDERVWSVVDAAHSIGQELDINLSEVQPDFWTSNCHKWLFAKRGCSALYIPFRNQHVIKASVPTGSFYIPLADRNGDPNIQAQFEWTGTIDFAPYLTVLDALEFRKWLGGEHKINEYCHDLAIKGGKLLAELWGTQLLDPEGTQTLNMVNVELPFPASFTEQPKSLLSTAHLVDSKLLRDEKAYCSWFFHNGKFWARCSAQVFNDISDFERVGQAWLQVIKELTQETN